MGQRASDQVRPGHTCPIFEFTQYFNDNESVTADPVRAGTAYVVWDRTVSPNDSPDANLGARAFKGPAWFSKTTDGGASRSTARPIFDPGQTRQTIGNEVVVDPRTGALYDFFDLFTASGPKPLGDHVRVIKSTDGGATWSDVTVVADQQDVNSAGTVGVTLYDSATWPRGTPPRWRPTTG